MGLSKIKSDSSWGDSAREINANFAKMEVDVSKLKQTTNRNKGYFETSVKLSNAYLKASLGDIAYVGYSTPYEVWIWNGSSWENSGKKENGLNVDLKDYYKKEELDGVKDYRLVDLSIYTEQLCSLGGFGWYMAGSAGRHKAIPVNGEEKVRILMGNNISYIGFLTSSYSPPYKADDSIPFCGSTPTRITLQANAVVEYDIPYDCKYVVLTTVDGAGDKILYESVELYSYASCPDRIDDLEKKIGNPQFGVYEWRNVDLSTLPQRECSLGGYNNEWYYDSGKGKHKAIPVDGRKKVRVTSVNETSYLGFVTSAYNPPYVYGDSVPYCESAKGRIELNKGIVSEYDIPSDCMYIILVTVDGAGTTIEYKDIELGFSVDGSLQDYIDETNNKIENINFQLSSGGGGIINVDLLSLPQMDCSLGGYNNEWYYESGKGKHKAIPVDGRKKVRVTSVNETSYLGFVTSAYNPPYAYGDLVPYCESAKGRIKLNKGVVSEYDIPSDCMYIILVTVDGAGTTIEYGSILLYDDVSIVDKLNSLEKQIEGGSLSGSNHSRIKVMSWNIGHYCNGTGVNTSITNDNYIEKRTAFRNLFNKCSADVIGLVEYSDIFNSSTGESAENAIIGQYSYKKFGGITVSGYVCNGVVSSVEIPYINVINFPIEYYAIETNLTYMGSKFVFCVAHLPWQSNEYNKQAITTLINRYANTEKVIIVGDFNVRADNDYDLFANAGYVMANHGYMGDIVTYPNESPSHILDNIIVKGGQILSTEVVESNLSDHYPIVSEIII